MKTSIQNQLMFLGTRQEVDNAAVVNKCMYFAWDTGEIFLGNNHNSKTKYGGSRDTLSATDITKIVYSELTPQLNINNRKIKELKNSQDTFIETVNNAIKSVVAKVDSINDATTAYIRQQVQSVLSGMETNFYTKDDINNLFGNYVTSATFNSTLSNVYTKKETDSKYITPVTGEYIYRNIVTLNGYYLCLSDYTSSNYNFYSGNIYSVSNGRYTEIASTGGGGGDASIKISTFTIAGSTYLLRASGSSLGSNVQLVTNISNGKFANNVGLYYDDNVVTNAISLDAGNSSKFLDLSVINNSDGRHVFKLNIMSKTGTLTTESINLDIVRPIFYGAGSSETPITSNLIRSSLKVDPSGKYSVTITDDKKYIWFVVPINGNDGMSVDDIKANGFTIPTISTVIDNYKYIRSANDINNGTVNFTVEGSANASFK